jgi:hypothetical protein
VEECISFSEEKSQQHRSHLESSAFESGRAVSVEQLRSKQSQWYFLIFAKKINFVVRRASDFAFCVHFALRLAIGSWAPHGPNG